MPKFRRSNVDPVLRISLICSTVAAPNTSQSGRISRQDGARSSVNQWSMRTMNRPLIALALVLAAATTQAEARSPIGGATMPRDPLQADPLGPRSEPTVTVATAVARTPVEKNGYTSVRGLA